MGSLTDEQNLSFEYTVVFLTLSFIAATSAKEVDILHQFLYCKILFLDPFQ